MKTFPTLYKKTNTGAIQQWTISAGQKMDGTGTITTSWGQVNGAIQETTDYVAEGKNPGKKNATTPAEQAHKEANAKWTKQLKKGYVLSLADANAGVVDEIIEGGVLPMLAPNKVYPADANLAKKILFPAFVQPKLDGARCIAMIVNGKATLWSRTRKPIRSVPHVIEALEARFPGQTVTLDGELYNHEYRNSFEDLMSIIRKDEPDAECLYEVIQYHVYDLVDSSSSFDERSRRLDGLLHSTTIVDCIEVVPTVRVTDQASALALQEKFEVQEYEGAMIRNAHGPYESGKRSSHLQKMKTFVDGEFDIVGAEEGRGKDAGTIGAFVCRTADNKGFKARLKATYARRRELFQNPAQWEQKRLTVTYKRFTADGVPYLPIGKAIRDYE